MPGHYRTKGTKATPMNKKMTMNRKQAPKKGTPAMKAKMAKLRSLKGKK
jgi:hypothetical protein